MRGILDDFETVTLAKLWIAHVARFTNARHHFWKPVCLFRNDKFFSSACGLFSWGG